MKIYKIKVLNSVVLHNGTEDIEYKGKEVFAVKCTNNEMRFFWEVETGVYGTWYLLDGDYEYIGEADINRLFDVPTTEKQEVETYEEHKKEVDQFASLESVLSLLSKNAKNIEFK